MTRQWKSCFSYQDWFMMGISDLSHRIMQEQTAAKKGKPNLTVDIFQKWVYVGMASLWNLPETAQLWLCFLGFSQKLIPEKGWTWKERYSRIQKSLFNSCMNLIKGAYMNQNCWWGKTAHPDSRWKHFQCKHRPEQSHTFNQIVQLHCHTCVVVHDIPKQMPPQTILKVKKEKALSYRSRNLLIYL